MEHYIQSRKESQNRRPEIPFDHLPFVLQMNERILSLFSHRLLLVLVTFRRIDLYDLGKPVPLLIRSVSLEAGEEMHLATATDRCLIRSGPHQSFLVKYAEPVEESEVRDLSEFYVEFDKRYALLNSRYVVFYGFDGSVIFENLEQPQLVRDLRNRPFASTCIGWSPFLENVLLECSHFPMGAHEISEYHIDSNTSSARTFRMEIQGVFWFPLHCCGLSKHQILVVSHWSKLWLFDYRSGDLLYTVRGCRCLDSPKSFCSGVCGLREVGGTLQVLRRSCWEEFQLRP
jgi:hypothetical protein